MSQYLTNGGCGLCPCLRFHTISILAMKTECLGLEVLSLLPGSVFLLMSTKEMGWIDSTDLFITYLERALWISGSLKWLRAKSFIFSIQRLESLGSWGQISPWCACKYYIVSLSVGLPRFDGRMLHLICFHRAPVLRRDLENCGGHQVGSLILTDSL